MAWANTVNVTSTGNSIAKSGGSSYYWDAGAVSDEKQSIQADNGYVQMTAGSDLQSVAFGLSSGDTNQGYEDIDFAIRLEAGGEITVYEGGVHKGSFGTFRPGNVFRVAVEGEMIKYYKNGVVFYSTRGELLYPLLMDTSLQEGWSGINDAWICTTAGGGGAGPGSEKGIGTEKGSSTTKTTAKTTPSPSVTATATKEARKPSSNGGKSQTQPVNPNVVNTLIYLHADHLGSVSVATNSTGTQVSSQEYDPWGKVRTGQGLGSITQTKVNYTGQKLDGTGLLYYHARYYDPQLGRFVSPDSVISGAQNNKLTVDSHESSLLEAVNDENELVLQEGFWFQLTVQGRVKVDASGPPNPQALNRYGYVLNNPIRYTDPTGHYCAEKDMGCNTNKSPGEIAWESEVAAYDEEEAADEGCNGILLDDQCFDEERYASGSDAMFVPADKASGGSQPKSKSGTNTGVKKANRMGMRSYIKNAGLPTKGPIRYIPPKGWKPPAPLPRGPNGGFIDRFSNEWVRGPARRPQDPYEWDVQLNPSGKGGLRWASQDGRHVNVSPDGVITHGMPPKR